MLASYSTKQNRTHAFPGRPRDDPGRASGETLTTIKLEKKERIDIARVTEPDNPTVNDRPADSINQLGDTAELIEWLFQRFGETTLPPPSLPKQRALVREYASLKTAGMAEKRAV